MSKPVLLISGFLGAGKTTFINRLLVQSKGRKLGVVLNEIGAAGVETSLVRARTGALKELAAGCLCCAGPEDLGKAFSVLMEAAPDLDGILVEASGLSHPGPVIRSLLDQGDAWGVEYLGHLCLVPAPDFRSLTARYTLAGFQMKIADLILMTKTEDLSPEQTDLLTALVSELAPDVPLIPRKWFPSWDYLQARLSGRQTASAAASGPLPFLESLGARIHGLDSWMFTSPRPLNPQLLGKVLEEAAPSLVRAKGYVYLDHRGAKNWKYLYQQTGSLRHLGSRPWKREEIRQSALVFYGPDLPVSRLETSLKECESHE